jgi:4-hydroxyproline epimerase
MAQLYAKGLLSPGDKFVHESFIGSQFTGTIEGITEVAGIPAILPGIEGWARVFGANQITVDDNDPYAYGFQVI